MGSVKNWLVIALLAPGLAACGSGGEAEKAAPVEEPPATVTNRIDVPAAVRKNLGITYVDVAYRHVSATRRVPGRFELRPDAHRAYHVTLAGQVELLVKQYQAVAPGDLLFRIHSPAWREMQLGMAKTVNLIRQTKSKLASIDERKKAVTDHGDRLSDEQKVWEDRLRELENLSTLGAGNRSARTVVRAQLASVRTSLAEVVEERANLQSEEDVLRAEILGYEEATPLLYAAACCEVAPAENHGAPGLRDLELARAAALLGVTVEYLRENVGSKESPIQRWRTINHIEVKARQAGVVEALHETNGAWVEVGEVVLGTVETRLIRFRAAGLQADLGVLKNGQQATILPPGGRAVNASKTMSGKLAISIEADPLTRKIDLIVVPEGDERPHWARDGVSTEVEIVLHSTADAQLAVPVSAVIQDGLDKIIFRRDPKNPDKVIRLKADLGLSDGRWVVVDSGVMEGDQVVDHGVYELMLTGGAGKEKGGHFHSDGTFHKGGDH